MSRSVDTPRDTRITPYELVFGPAVFEDEWFPRIAEEAEGRAVEAMDPGRFVMLGTTGQLLRRLRPETVNPEDAVGFYGALAFHAFHFWRAGRTVHVIETEALRRTIAVRALGEWAFDAPERAGYLELPRHLVWTHVDETAAPEPVEGIFWVQSALRLDLLICSGVREGRAGLGVIDVSAQLPAPPPGHWGNLDAREDAADFSNVLPGGDIESLLAIVTPAETLKLVSRVFHGHAHGDAPLARRNLGRSDKD